jgi:flagellar basal-body rod protein FlgG
MESQQLNLDVISNNLANVNTTGFKRSKAEFQELLYQTTRAPGADQGSGNVLPTGIQVGQGSKAVATARVFTNGDLTQTGEQLDVAVQGDGFFEVQMPDGTLAYTRDGAFKTSSDGRIVTSDGLPLQAGFQPVPAGTVIRLFKCNWCVSPIRPASKAWAEIFIAKRLRPARRNWARPVPTASAR